ncbi:MAG: amino acid transporter [Marivirga sp.]|jgi:amino acid transporter
MAKQNKFGTFGGVFVPSILTILGVIMYLRLPMIIGEAGLWATIGIIIVAHIISVTTGLSVSSIATDKKVAAGGTYYMISRSLGLPIGGTLGLALFVGLSFSVSLYLIGFSESFLNYWGYENSINNIRITGTVVLIAVTTVTFISTSLAIKTQYFIMAAIVLSLISIFAGDHDYTPSAPIFSNPTSTVSLMVLFGIFFPAVTGFEAGVSMSGDLKDAKKSIPSGSIAAIVVGFVVYILLAFYFSYTVDSQALISDPQILLNISWMPELVIAGIWGATLSSALGSILGAPRILQATAVDRITPKLFAKGYGATNEPRNALLLTFVIAEAGILIGELDVIARVVSIFFITTYGFLNISATFERWTSTDFRPEFKVPGWISILGAAACILVMIQLDFVAMLAAILILGLLFLYLKRKELSLASGDAWSGVWASLVKTGITNLKRDKLHKRNWRPNIIMFSGSPHSREHLIELGKAISGKLGILSSFELVESQDPLLMKTESNLHEDKEDNEYFQHKLYCPDVYAGIDQIARVYGFSGIEPNTILMGWTRNAKNREKFIALAESFDRNNYNSIFLNYNQEKKFGQHRQIDIWWSGAGRNLSLAINLMRNINNSSIWKEAKVRVLVVNPTAEEAETIYKATAILLSNLRVEAEIRVINNHLNPVPLTELITAESASSDLTIIGVPNQRYRHMEAHYDELNEILEAGGTSMVINASDDFAEMEVISPTKGKSKIEQLKEADFTLPPIAESIHPEIVADIQKIDANGQKALHTFHKKLLQPILTNRIEMLTALKGRLEAIRKEYATIDEIPDHYRKKKSIDKLKNDTFYKIDHYLNEEIKEITLEAEESLFAQTIDWYDIRLWTDFKQFPFKLTIQYSKADFATLPDDRAGLKAYKRLKKLQHWLLRKPIRHSLHYREVARYYQLNNRKVFLNHYLKQFEQEEEDFYHELRSIIGAITDLIDHAERKIWQEEQQWNDANSLEKLGARIAVATENQKKLLHIYDGRLLLEFRKNLQLMSYELGKIDVDHLIKKKRRPAKYYAAVAASNKDFGEERHLRVKTFLNMILMELSVNATKNRLDELQEQFGVTLKSLVNNKYVKVLDGIIAKTASSTEQEILQKINVDDNFEVELQELFRENMGKMLGLTEAMPEAIEIYSYKQVGKADQEILAIPVAKMAEYYLKSQYEVIIEERFGRFLAFLKRSVYSVRDALNLAQFNLENTDATHDSKEAEILLAALGLKLEKEKESIQTEIETFKDFSSSQFELAFEPLSSAKIEESASDFILGLRSYQGKQVLSGLSRISGWVKKTTFGLTTKLFYSRSEGILLAKKLKKSKELNSANSQLLAVKEKVSPTQEILNALPPYYVTLFNGKSNIGQDFWISRMAEEKTFSKAIKRYQQGFSGGILLLGERNSGKTAFGRHMTLQMKGHKVYALFPPVQGDITRSAFSEALTKATQMRGDIDQIFAALPHGSVLIINDLELFWERQSEGLALILLLQQLIDNYAQRILFIVNMNPHAFRLINQLTPLADHFIEIVNFAPFDAEDIKELIMKRHRSSGLAISYKKNQSPLNEVQLARHFDSYFNYSGGNPGTALNGWLAHIKKNLPDRLIVDRPEAPSLESLEHLHEDWTMLLTLFVLHKRLTAEKIIRICGWTSEKVRSQLLAMLRTSIIQEKASGIYHINPFIQPFVVKALKEQEVLK